PRATQPAAPSPQSNFSFAAPRDDDAPVAVGRHGAYEPGFLHLFQQPRGTVVADAHLALRKRNRPAPLLPDARDGPGAPRVARADAAAGDVAGEDVAALAVQRAAFEEAFDVVRLALGLQVTDDAVHVVVADELAVRVYRQPGPPGDVQHLAHAQQHLRAQL